MKTYHIRSERGEDGWLVGRAEELPGAITRGRDLDELAVMVRDAIGLLTDESEFQIDLMLPAGVSLDSRRACLGRRRHP